MGECQATGVRDDAVAKQAVWLRTGALASMAVPSNPTKRISEPLVFPNWCAEDSRYGAPRELLVATRTARRRRRSHTVAARGRPRTSATNPTISPAVQRTAVRDQVVPYRRLEQCARAGPAQD